MDENHEIRKSRTARLVALVIVVLFLGAASLCAQNHPYRTEYHLQADSDSTYYVAVSIFIGLDSKMEKEVFYLDAHRVASRLAAPTLRKQRRSARKFIRKNS